VLFPWKKKKHTTIWAIDPVHTKIRFDAKYLMITSVSGWLREIEGSVVGVAAFTGGLIGDKIYPENYAGDFQADQFLSAPAILIRMFRWKE
jgi:hypothetical protein